MGDKEKHKASTKRGREVLKAYRQKRPVRDVVVLDLRTSRQKRGAGRRELRCLNPSVIMALSNDAREVKERE